MVKDDTQAGGADVIEVNTAATALAAKEQALAEEEQPVLFECTADAASPSTTLAVTPELCVPKQPVQAVPNAAAMRAFAGPGLVDEGGYSKSGAPIISNGHRHGFIAAVTTAFADHYPLQLRPQHIWLLVLQGVATHVDLHSEELRKKWVAHEGKKTLVVGCDDFVKGNANSWETVVHGRSDCFAAQIASNLLEGVSDVLSPSFTGAQTTAIENVAQKIVVMDICKNYFTYKCMTMCGFPSITLEGSAQDWQLLRQHAEQLLLQQCKPEFAASWSKALLPVLDKFVTASATGEVDERFWNSLCKRGGTQGSGSRTWFNGWMNVLFPYIDSNPNRYCVPYSPSAGYVQEGREEKWYCRFREPVPEGVQGPDCEDFPSGRSEAPVIWEYLGTKINLKFVSGFVGATQDPETLAISPHVGWFIVAADETRDDNEGGLWRGRGRRRSRGGR